MIKLIVLFVTLLGSGIARAEVPPCNFSGDPWQVLQPVYLVDPQRETGYVEYKELVIPFEVEILKGSGSVKCIFNPQPGVVSLVLPNGFNPEVDHYVLNPGMLSWFKVEVGNARYRYPILSKYNLTVVPAPETKAYYLPQEQTQIFQRPSPLLYNNHEEPRPPQPVVESRCGGWCVAGWTVAGILLGKIIWDQTQNKSNPPPPPPPPPAMTTGGSY